MVGVYDNIFTQREVLKIIPESGVQQYGLKKKKNNKIPY